MMFQRINQKYILKNTVLSSEKAYKDAVQLNLNTTQVYSITVDSTQKGKALTIFSVPPGSVYKFLSASYGGDGLNDITNLSIEFPGGFASANITAPYNFSSIANPVTEGEVKVLVGEIIPSTSININICILTE